VRVDDRAAASFAIVAAIASARRCTGQEGVQHRLVERAPVGAVLAGRDENTVRPKVPQRSPFLQLGDGERFGRSGEYAGHPRATG
jgi:hypothetical protein